MTTHSKSPKGRQHEAFPTFYVTSDVCVVVMLCRYCVQEGGESIYVSAHVTGSVMHVNMGYNIDSKI